MSDYPSIWIVCAVQNPTLQVSPMTAVTRGRTAPVLSGVLTSLVLHGALIGAVILGSMYAGESEDDVGYEVVFDQVELLALGEEKPPNELPRLPNPAAAPTVPESAPTVPVDDTPPPVEVPPEVVPDPSIARDQERVQREEQAKSEADARQKRMQDALSALHNPDRPTNTDTPAGSADGIVGGTVSDAAMASMMGTYQAKLLAEIQRYWEVPSTISTQEKAALAGQVHVYVRLSEGGHIVSYTFRNKSTNEQYNDSIERVLKRFQAQYGGRSLPMPDHPEVRQVIVTRGLEMKNWEAVNR